MLKHLLLLLLTFTFYKPVNAQKTGRFEIEQPVIFKSDTIYGSLLTHGDLRTFDFTSQPLIIIISGSGATDRDGNTAGSGAKNNSLQQFADSLLSNNIATFRYDKPGVGKSTFSGKMEDFLFEDIVNAAQNVVDKMANLGFKNIYLAGHSQGSLVALLVANQDNKVKGVISLAGAGRPALELLKEQLSKSPFVPESIREETLLKLDSLAAGKRVKKYNPFNAAMLRSDIQPFLISYNKYDPAKEAARLKQPLLIVQGKMDLQVTDKDAELLKSAKPESTLLYYEQMTHLLKKIENVEDNLKSYNDSSFPLQPDLTHDIAAWIGQLQ